jgi:hypothetical protein
LKNIKTKNKMAFVSTNSQIKKNILNYISRLVSKTLYRSIEILFKPCCDITITNVEAVCTVDGDPGNYDITITLDKSINMLGNGLLFVLVEDFVTVIDNSALIPYNDSNKIVLLDANIGDSSGGPKGVSVFFLLSASPATSLETLTPGVFTLATSDLDWNFPNCTTP